MFLSGLAVLCLTGCPPTMGNANDNGDANDNEAGAGADRPTAFFSWSVFDPNNDPLTVFFNASQSAAKGDRTLVEYVWDYGDGSEAETRTVNVSEHTFPTGGSYDVTLTVRDSADETSSFTDTVTVQSPPFAVASLSVDPSEIEFDQIGDTIQLAVIANYNDGTTADVTADDGTTYTSSAPAVASVDPNGLVTSIGNGSATISVSHGGVTGQVAVNIDAPPPPDALEFDIVVTPGVDVEVGEEMTLTIEVTSGGALAAVMWGVVAGDPAPVPFTNPAGASTMYDTSVAGDFSIVAVVTDSFGQEASQQVDITVTEPPVPTLTSLTVTPDPIALDIVGDTVQLLVEGNFSDETTADLTADEETTYESEAADVVSVTTGGLVTAVDFGIGSIVVTNGDVSRDVVVTVGEVLDVEIAADPGTDVVVGQPLTLTVALVNGDPIAEVLWEVLDDAPSADPFDDPTEVSTSFDTSVEGTYDIIVTVADDIGQEGVGSIVITVGPNPITVNAGDDEAVVPNSMDFGGADIFSDGAILTSGGDGGNVSSLAATASGGDNLTYEWSVAGVPGPATAEVVLVLQPEEPETDFLIENITADQPGIFDSGLEGMIANAVVPGTYVFEVVATSDDGVTNSDQVLRTVTPGFDIPALETGSFEGLSLRFGFVTHRVLSLGGSPLEFSRLTRQSASLEFSLEDLDNGTISAQQAIDIEPAAMPGIEDFATTVTPPTRGTYDVKATLVDGLLPEGVTDPQSTGYTVHAQADYPNVIAVDPANSIPHVGLVNSATDNTGVQIHGGLTEAGGGTNFRGHRIQSVDINNDGFPETVLLSAGSIRVFSGLNEAAFDVSPVDNSKNNDGEIDNDGVQLASSGSSIFTDVCFADFNSDGFVDMVSGSGMASVVPDGPEGRIDVCFHNGTTDLDASPYDLPCAVRIRRVSLESLDADMFGYSVACGDVNGDNIPDVVVGAPQAEFNDGIIVQVAEASVSPDILVADASGFFVGDRIVLNRGLGSQEVVDVVNIIDGGGGNDTIVTSGYVNALAVGDNVQRLLQTGAVYGFDSSLVVVPGNYVIADDNSSTPDADGMFIVKPDSRTDRAFIGASVAIDSAGRVIYGAPGMTNDDGLVNAGKVMVNDDGAAFFDLVTGDPVTISTPDLIYEGDVAQLAIGRRLAVGDVDGDGTDDIVASGSQVTGTTQSAANARGAIVVIPGDEPSIIGAGLSSLPKLFSSQTRNLGATLAVGDFDHDGIDDILTTAPASGTSNQRVFVIRGKATLPAALSADQTILHSMGLQFLDTPVSLSGSIGGTAILYRAEGCQWSDLNGDGVLDLVFTGLDNSDFEGVFIAGRE